MAALVLLVPGMLSASAIGTLDIAGSKQVSVNASTVDFGTGPNFTVTFGSGAFSVIPAGTPGTITTLTPINAPPGVPIIPALDPFVLVPGFFDLNLESVLVGGAPSCAVVPAVGFNCTPSNLVPASPFVLTQNNGSVGVQFSVLGTVKNLSDLSQAPYKGLFTANLTVLDVDTVAEVLAKISGGGSVQSSWSAEFTSFAVPEPTSFVLIGLGMLGLGILAKRRKSVA